jgi:hypothetical protein
MMLPTSRPLFVLVQSQVKPFYSNPISLRYILILNPRPHLGLESGSFLQVSPHQNPILLPMTLVSRPDQKYAQRIDRQMYVWKK